MNPVKILSPTFQLLAVIDDYESLVFTRRWHRAGEFELRINRHKRSTDMLQKGNILFLDTHKVGLIKHREIGFDENGKISEQWLIKGIELKGVVAQRVITPPAGVERDSFSGSAELVMKYYVYEHIINPTDTYRKINQVTFAPNLDRGKLLDWHSRYKNLAEELEKISLLTGLGWSINLDLTLNKWVFDVFEGRDLTVNQSINPPVIFSPEFESLHSQHYADSNINHKNFAYVGGVGEGTERSVYSVYGKSLTGKNSVTNEVSEETDLDLQAGTLTDVVLDTINDLIKLDTTTGTIVGEKLEDFEDITYQFTFTGDWLRITSSPEPYQDTYCFGSANISHNQTSTVETTVTIESGGGSVEFYYNVSSESGFDKFSFYVDSVKVLADKSGTINWTLFTYSLTAGTHTLKWEYKKDGSVSNGYDRAAIDNLKITGVSVPNTVYKTQGYRISPPYPLNPMDRVDSSLIRWESDTPTGTDVVLQVSLDEGVTWKTVSQDSEVVTAGEPLTATSIKAKQILTTTDNKFTSTYSSCYILIQGINEQMAPEVTGLDVIETFIDARDLSTQAELQLRGKQELSLLEVDTMLEAEILPQSPFVYEKDWDLGDIVTVQNKGWGITMDTRITEVKEIYEPTGFRLAAVFGTNWPTLINKLKQELNQLGAELRK